MTNELLISALVSVAHSTLPCVIIGDFNCPLDELSIWPSLQLRGWVDAASWNEMVTGIAPAMTYRGETRIDFILMSPSLCRFWDNFECRPDAVSDHAQLELCLQIPGSLPRVLRRKACRDSEALLRQAREAGWDPSTFSPRKQTLHSHSHVEQMYMDFVSNFEDMISEAYGYCHSLLPLKNFKGRSRPKKILQPTHAPVVKNPRQREPTFPVDDAPTKLRQHIRQCRRVSSAFEQLLSYTRTNAERALEAALETWYAVVHAPGFDGGFTKFAWEQLGIQIPEWITTHDIPILRILVLRLRELVPKWVNQLAKAQEHSHKLFFNDDWGKGGKFHALAIKPPPKPQIAMMDLSEPGQVIRLRHCKHGPFWVSSVNAPLRPLEQSCVMASDMTFWPWMTAVSNSPNPSLDPEPKSPWCSCLLPVMLNK